MVMTLILKAETALHGTVAREVDVDAHRIMLGTIVRRRVKSVELFRYAAEGIKPTDFLAVSIRAAARGRCAE